MFHGKSAKSRRTAKSREYIDDSDSSADLALVEEMVNQLDESEKENDTSASPPRINPDVQSTFDRILGLISSL